MMWSDGSGWGWGWFGPVFMLLFWGGLIVLAVWAVGRFTSPRGYSTTREDSPIEILRSRFARGEIDPAEFEEKLRLLGR